MTKTELTKMAAELADIRKTNYLRVAENFGMNPTMPNEKELLRSAQAYRIARGYQADVAEMPDPM